jgi:RNA polymerase sigma-70 factor (ECF subfamily)
MRLGEALDCAERTDEQLAAEAAREDSDGPAFRELVARYRERVWRICYRLMGDHQDALDATQEVLVRMFMGRRKYEGRSRYSTWVYGIAVRTCLVMRRSRGRRLQRVQPVDNEVLTGHSSRDGAGHEGLSVDLADLLERLDSDDRTMLVLKYVENHPYEEIAAMFDLSVSACKMRVLRARKQLQSELSERRSEG